MAIELAAGATPAQAREAALAAMGERDAAFSAIVLPEPPAMPPADFLAHVRGLTHALEGAAKSASTGSPGSSKMAEAA